MENKVEMFRIGFMHMLKTCRVGTFPSLEVLYRSEGKLKVKSFTVETLSTYGKFKQPSHLEQMPDMKELFCYLRNVLMTLDGVHGDPVEIIYHGELQAGNVKALGNYVWRECSKAA